MIRYFKNLYKFHPLRFLLCIAIPILLYNNLIPGNSDFDSQYYLSAIDNITNGRIDCLRTPTYPLFLKLCLISGGNNMIVVVTLIQSLVYLVSIFCFFKIINKLVHSKNIATFITLLYISLPAPNWCSMILTESFSISGMVIVLHYIILFFEKPSWKLSIIIGLILLVLVFLRPTFTILFLIVPSLLIFNYFNGNTTRKILLTSLPIIIIPLCCFLLYCKEYQKEYGVYTSSFKAPVYQLKRGEMWDEQFLSDKSDLETFHAIDTLYNGSYDFIFPLVDDNAINISKIYHLCESLKAEQRHKYYMYQLLLFSKSCDYPFAIYEYNRRTTLGRPLYFVYKFFSFHLSFVYLLTMSWVVILIIMLMKRRFNWAHALVVSICLCHCVGIGGVASEAFGRLMLPIFPAFLLLLGISLDGFTKKLKGTT